MGTISNSDAIEDADILAHHVQFKCRNLHMIKSFCIQNEEAWGAQQRILTAGLENDNI